MISTWAPLVAAVQRDDERAILEMRQLFWHCCRGTITRILGRADEAEEALQDAFCDLVMSIRKHGLRDPERLMGCMRTTGRNAAFDRLRRHQRNRKYLVDISDFAKAQIPSTTRSAEKALLDAEVPHRLDIATGIIGARETEALRRQASGESMEEIADAMGASIAAVKTMLWRARYRARAVFTRAA